MFCTPPLHLELIFVAQIALKFVLLPHYHNSDNRVSARLRLLSFKLLHSFITTIKYSFLNNYKLFFCFYMLFCCNARQIAFGYSTAFFVFDFHVMHQLQPFLHTFILQRHFVFLIYCEFYSVFHMLFNYTTRHVAFRYSTKFTLLIFRHCN